MTFILTGDTILSVPLGWQQSLCTISFKGCSLYISMNLKIHKAPSELTSERLSLGSHISTWNVLNALITFGPFSVSPTLSGYTEFTMNGYPDLRHDFWRCWTYHAQAVEIICIFTVTTGLKWATSNSTTAKTRLLDVHKSIKWPKILFFYPDRIQVGKQDKLRKSWLR